MTSTTKRARWSCVSQSSNDGGSKKSVLRSARMKLDMFKITYRDRLNFNIFATFSIAKSRVFRSGKSDRLLELYSASKFFRNLNINTLEPAIDLPWPMWVGKIWKSSATKKKGLRAFLL